MRILVIGSGGREHALVWRISESEGVDRIYCAPGNPGIAQLAECVAIEPADLKSLLRFALQNKIDLVVPGGEEPLAAGITNLMTDNGLRVFGPSREAAELESSKVFAKTVLRKHAIPTAEFRVMKDYSAALDYVRTAPSSLVIKADGLAKGKGVIVCRTTEEAEAAVRLVMKDRAFGDAGNQVVIEERLMGQEVSILALTDGETILAMPPSQDHKPVFDNDRGPNTGGMGAYSPVPVVTEEMSRRIELEILVPTIHGMKMERRTFRGCLYAGLMLTRRGPRVLEFNVRFGDPEAQPLLMRLRGDFLKLLVRTVEGKLDEVEADWDPRAAVCVVMASGGYPGDYRKGLEISGLDEAAKCEDVQVFHAGTALKDGKIVTNGGRVLGVTALGDGVKMAMARAYEAVSRIHFEGAHYRRDVGAKALAWEAETQGADRRD